MNRRRITIVQGHPDADHSHFCHALASEYELLKGRSARIFVTMGMPAAAYRLIFRAHGVKSLDSSVLALSGFRPIHDTFIGSVESLSKKSRDRHLADAHSFGEEGR